MITPANSYFLIKRIKKVVPQVGMELEKIEYEREKWEVVATPRILMTDQALVIESHLEVGDIIYVSTTERPEAKLEDGTNVYFVHWRNVLGKENK